MTTSKSAFQGFSPTDRRDAPRKPSPPPPSPPPQQQQQPHARDDFILGLRKEREAGGPRFSIF
jgi:hypothetical protein